MIFVTMSATRKRYCIFGCDALFAQSVPLHQFPHPQKRPDIFAAWVSAVGDKLRGSDPMKIFKNKRMCDNHFEQTQKATGRRLIWSAIPTVHLNSVQQSIATIVRIDHSYCRSGRVLPGPTSPLSAISNICQTPQKTCDAENVDRVIKDDSFDNEKSLSDEVTGYHETQLLNDDRASEVPHPVKKVSSKTEVASIRCDGCLAVINGVRYHCMQCADVDFCSECEARGNHETHYMLRVPQYKPLAEVRSVLTAVQQALDSALAAAQELITIKDELDLKQEADSETTIDPLLDPLSEHTIFCNKIHKNINQKSVTALHESNCDRTKKDMVCLRDDSDETNYLFFQKDYNKDRVNIPVKKNYKRKCVKEEKSDQRFMKQIIIEMNEDIREANQVSTNEEEFIRRVSELHKMHDKETRTRDSKSVTPVTQKLYLHHECNMSNNEIQ